MKDMKPYVDIIRAVDVNKYKKLSEKSLEETISDKVACGSALMMIFALDDFADSERAELTMKWLEKFVKAVESESDAHTQSAMIDAAKEALATIDGFDCENSALDCEGCVFGVLESGNDWEAYQCMRTILERKLKKMTGEDNDELMNEKEGLEK